MPTVEITTNAFTPEQRCSVAEELTAAIAALGIPRAYVTIIFRSVDAVFDGGKPVALAGFASVDITAQLPDESSRRSLTKAIAALLVTAGVSEDVLKIIFRNVANEDVAVGDGTFPFWPE